MTNEEYHARPHLSASKLAVWRESPLRYQATYLTKERERKASPAMELGSLVDMILTEPGTTAGRYAIFDGDRRTKAGKEAWAAIIAGGRIPIKPELCARAHCIARAITLNHGAGMGIEGARTQVVYQSKIHGVPCQCKFDYVTRGTDGPVGLDLKTCADITRIQRDFFRWNYHLQAAFYQLVSGIPMAGFLFVETTPPYETALLKMDAELVELSRQKVMDDILVFSRHYERDYWPSWQAANCSDGLLSVPSWMIADDLDPVDDLDEEEAGDE